MKLLNNNKEQIDNIDFGIVEAGKEKIIKCFLFNDSLAYVEELKLNLNSLDLDNKDSIKEISIIKYPEKLNPNEYGEVEIKWLPSIDLKRALRASVSLTGTEIYK
ncbi:MAG: hypothetical protein WC860_07090 [Candidatus Margulisiibacteriota bacterium]|jgi:hypothetical protein